MGDEWNLWRSRILGSGRAALGAGAGVVKGLEVSGVAECGRTRPDPDAGLVHHVEHGGETAVRLADEVPDSAGVLAEIEQGVRGAAVAHLVVEPGERDVVAGADRAVGVHQILGHHE